MSLSIKRILYPTDFSQPSLQARNYSYALADKFGAELHAIHIFDRPFAPMGAGDGMWIMPEESLPKMIHEAELKLALYMEQEANIDCKLVKSVRVGGTVEEILAYVRQNDIDLIVMGTHGYTGFSHLLLGSVAEKLVRLAQCPVLTVHPKGHQFVTDDESWEGYSEFHSGQPPVSEKVLV